MWDSCPKNKGGFYGEARSSEWGCAAKDVSGEVRYVRRSMYNHA